MDAPSTGIAIVGMAGRFPRARSLDEYWRNVRDGAAAIEQTSDEEVAAAHIPEELWRDAAYVKAAARLEDVELFDAAFFGVTPKEAEILDPQQRLLLECAWEALEHAGYDPELYPGRIGVFAGAAMSSYLGNLSRHPETKRAFTFFHLLLANDKDHLATRVAYKLNLRGPAVGVQTACSTSLVAVHVACETLLSRQCDMALAGGVMVRVSPYGPQEPGYLYHEGGITSPDGRCRTFDARAKGTVFGNGVGLVVLKRLADAVNDGDRVHAVVKGSAVNNDGAARVGYTAPSVDGQASVIAEALAVARVEPDTIGYVEAHGTGTPLGDPIEIAALTKAFRARTANRQFCAVGSVKANVGHLETAAGIAGLLKAVLALEHGQIPPQIDFDTPNPQIDFAASPFYVPTGLTDWPERAHPRRAGVSSFGMGGTNAHVILEEAPRPQPSRSTAGPWQLLLWSARTATALETMTDRLAGALEAPTGTLADAAFTLRAGRRSFAHRRAVVCRDEADARAALTARDPERLLSGVHEGPRPEVVFLFPGQGCQYVDMARELYEHDAVFRERLDYGARVLKAYAGGDLREILYPGPAARDAAARQLTETAIAQPALFVVEHALARALMAWGVSPDAMIGHSVGEYVAATLAGVFTLEDALALVAARGRFMQDLPRGAMLAVSLPESELTPLLGYGLDLAAVNAAASCVVAGPTDAIESFEAQLAARGVSCRRLRTSHAFHSRMLDPIVSAFAARVAQVPRRPPALRWISNVTGHWIAEADAVDPRYWGQHLRRPVRFSDGLRLLAGGVPRLFVEVGPGRALGALAKREVPPSRVVETTRAAQEDRSDLATFLTAVGRLWLGGVMLKRKEQGRRVPLPTYPFERKRYWITPPVRREPASQTAGSETSAPAPAATAAAGPAPPPAREAARPAHDEGREPAALRDAITVIWRELLGVERIGPHDNFFDLGGDSLLATQMATRLRAELRAQLPLDVAFARPTVAALAEHLGCSSPSAPRAGAASLERVPRTGPLPLSFAQQRLFVLDQLAPGNPFYNVPVAVHLAGPIDPDALARSLEDVVERHEVLRTTYSVVEGRPLQQVHAAMPPEFQAEDLEGLPVAEREPCARRRMIEESRRPFDLGRGPMLRALLLRTAPGSHDLVLTMHHITCDAWSIGVLLGDLAAIYAGRVQGTPPALPPLAIQYADAAVWQRRSLDGEGLREHLAYWTRQLANLPTLALPGARPAPPEPTYRGEQQRLEMDEGLTAAVKELAHAENATVFMVLLAVFDLVLAHYSGQHDVVVGTDVANRTHPAVEPVMGFFVNQLVLRTDVSGNPTFRELLRRVRRMTLEAYAHQDLPFDRLVEALNPPRNDRGMPLFQVKFVLQNAPKPELALQGLTFTPVTLEHGTAKFDLLFNLEESRHRIGGTLEYSTDVFDAPLIVRMLADFELVAARVARQADLTFDALRGALLEAERHGRTRRRQVEEMDRRLKLLNYRRTAPPVASTVEEA